MASGGIQIADGHIEGTVIVRAREQPTLQLFFDPDYEATTRVTIFWRAYAQLDEIYQYLNRTFNLRSHSYRAIFDYTTFEFQLPPASAAVLPRLVPNNAEAGICATYGEPAFVRYEVLDKRFPASADLVLWGALATSDELADFRSHHVIEQNTRKEVGVYLSYQRARELLQTTAFLEFVERTLVPNTVRTQVAGVLEACLTAMQDKLPSDLREDPSPFRGE